MFRFSRNSVFVLLLGVLIFFQYRLWFEQGGVRDMLALRQSLVLQEAQTVAMKKSNDELVMQVKRLRHGANTTESRARTELGMIKKGEIFYQYIK